VNELDNRASNFYLALYWANFMAEVDPDFVDLAQKLQNARPQIVAELKMCQGKQQDIGGYYQFDEAKVANAMRPSPTFNKIIENN
jgi:isocitrate dehydrogenase